MKTGRVVILGCFLLFWTGILRCDFASAVVNWSEHAPISQLGRPNPFEFSKDQLNSVIQKGRSHAVYYPVTSTALLAPYEPLVRLIEEESYDPLVSFLRFLLNRVKSFSTLDDVFKWVGLNEFPALTDEGVYAVPLNGMHHPTHRMGLTFIKRGGALGFTVGCAACHSSRLFGKTVLGMTNRFPRANAFFYAGKKGTSLLPTAVFDQFIGRSEGENVLYRAMKERLTSVGVKLPQVLGLDTSLAQVALSMSRRTLDAEGSQSEYWARHPRHEILKTQVADSKPAPWWNVKYKNRWLLDGSVVSGNPVYTNIIWNELGRGATLSELKNWLQQNEAVIQELTTAVFSSQAPRMTDFFSPERIEIKRAIRGEKLFLQACAKCHGIYEKAWSLENGESLPLVQRLQTTRVLYHAQTPVINVGTDPLRALGMTSLARALNPLKISQENGISIVPQKGYVPPPLVGIWARWPYFHNNSVPDLCSVLTVAENRPKEYWAGEANDPERDFDSNCVGYPKGSNVPADWFKNRAAFYDTSRAGMSNQGHSQKILIRDGKEIFSAQQKKDLIEYLKTL